MNLVKLAAASALALAAGMAPALAETLKVTTFLPPKHTFVKAVTAWGEELAEKSGGALTLEVFPAAQLGPPPRQFDLVRAGAADIGIVLHAMTPGRFNTTALAGLPLTHPSAGDRSEISSRRLTELAAEHLAAEHAGTRILWMAVTPPLRMHLAKADPSDLKNLEGLRIRYAGKTWAQIVEALGADPAPVPPAESADAMAKGVVDGATFPFEATMAFDLGPVSKFSTDPGFASATFAVVIGDAAWSRLSPEHRALVEETTGPDRAAWFGALWDASEAHGRAYMEKAGVKVVTMSDAQMADLKARFAPIVDAAVKAGGGKAEAFLSAYED